MLRGGAGDKAEWNLGSREDKLREHIPGKGSIPFGAEAGREKRDQYGRHKAGEWGCSGHGALRPGRPIELHSGFNRKPRKGHL